MTLRGTLYAKGGLPAVCNEIDQVYEELIRALLIGTQQTTSHWTGVVYSILNHLVTTAEDHDHKELISSQFCDCSMRSNFDLSRSLDFSKK